MTDSPKITDESQTLAEDIPVIFSAFSVEMQENCLPDSLPLICTPTHEFFQKSIDKSGHDRYN